MPVTIPPSAIRIQNDTYSCNKGVLRKIKFHSYWSCFSHWLRFFVLFTWSIPTLFKKNFYQVLRRKLKTLKLYLTIAFLTLKGSYMMRAGKTILSAGTDIPLFLLLDNIAKVSYITKNPKWLQLIERCFYVLVKLWDMETSKYARVPNMLQVDVANYYIIWIYISIYR